MTRLSSSFVHDRQLILVEAEVGGPTGRTTEARLVLDTGAAATTLTPRVIEKVGYTRRDGFKRAKVHTAIGEDHGYWVRVAVAEGAAKRQGEDGQISYRTRQLKDRPGG